MQQIIHLSVKSGTDEIMRTNAFGERFISGGLSYSLAQQSDTDSGLGQGMNQIAAQHIDENNQIGLQFLNAGELSVVGNLIRPIQDEMIGVTAKLGQAG